MQPVEKVSLPAQPGLIGVSKTTGPSEAPISPTAVPVKKQISTPKQPESIIQPPVRIEEIPTFKPTTSTTKVIGKQPQKRPVKRRGQTRQQTRRKAPVRRTRRAPAKKRTTRKTRAKRTIQRPVQTEEIETEEQNV